jgi:hypothetical protein
MNPTVEAILQHNSADIKAIVDKIGVETLLALAPNFMRIMATAQAQQPAKVV